MKKLLLFIALIIYGMGLNAQNFIEEEITIDYEGYSITYLAENIENETTGYSVENIYLHYSESNEPIFVKIPENIKSKSTDKEYNITSLRYYGYDYYYHLISYDDFVPIHLEIPNTIKYIGQEAFNYYEIRGLRCLAESVPESFHDIFLNYNESHYYMLSIQVPESSIELYKEAEQWKKFNITKIFDKFAGEEYVVKYDNYSLTYTMTNFEPYECSVGCYLQADDWQENLLAAAEINEITIPSNVYIDEINYTVTSIEQAGFSDLYFLKNIEMPNTIWKINDYAFNSYLMTEIKLPEGVSIVGDYIFSMPYLTNIEFPSTTTVIGCLYDNIFYYLKSITCHAKEVPETSLDAFMTIPPTTIIYVPKESVSLYQSAIPWCHYQIEAIENSVEGLCDVDAKLVNDKSFLIYPNPVKDVLNIEADERIEEISIYNLTGALIYENALINNNINVSDLTEGVYIIKVKTETSVLIKRFIKG